jgi:hypothetical protein
VVEQLAVRAVAAERRSCASPAAPPAAEAVVEERDEVADPVPGNSGYTPSRLAWRGTAARSRSSWMKSCRNEHAPRRTPPSWKAVWVSAR